MADLESRTFESFRELLRYVRKKKGLKSVETARLFGNDSRGYSSFIGQVERGEQLQSLSLVRNVIQFWDLDPKYVCDIDFNDQKKKYERWLSNRADALAEASVASNRRLHQIYKLP